MVCYAVVYGLSYYDAFAGSFWACKELLAEVRVGLLFTEAWMAFCAFVWINTSEGHPPFLCLLPLFVAVRDLRIIIPCHNSANGWQT